MRFILGLIIGVLLVPAAVMVYLRLGHPPVAVRDPAFPMEAQVVHVPLHARVDRDAPKQAPLEASESNLQAGAHIYRQQCAVCHGLYGRPSPYEKAMFPGIPQLWAPHGNGVVGVSDDPPGETYWKVANGIRLSGMPGFDRLLSQTEMWQVSLLLANADKPLPGNVLSLLKQPLAVEDQSSEGVPAKIE